MNQTRRIGLAPKHSLAFWGLSLALLLAACSQEPAGSPSPASPPPPAPSPPQVESPSQVDPALGPEPVLKVVQDPSGRHHAQVVQRQDQQVVIRDGQPGPAYDWVGEVAFSADGESLAYVAKKGRERVMVLDDREWPLKAAVVQDSLKVSPDHRRLALAARHQEKWQVMVDGRPDPPFDFIFMETFRFSPDSRRVGYLALKGNKLAAVVDGKVRGQWDILALGDKALKEALSRTDNVDVASQGEEKKE
jgi:glucose/arabinose dehydrogenase